MGRGRLEAFSDGVMAVAITLLALDLAVAGPGHGSLPHQLGSRWPAYAAYVVSFFTIGVVWVNHHDMVRRILVVDRLLLFLNLALLLFVVAIPFATSTMAEYLRDTGTDGHVAAALYAGVLLGMALGFLGLFEWSLVPGRTSLVVASGARRAARLRFSIGTFVYVVALGAAFISPVITLVLSGAVVSYYMAQRTPTGADGPEVGIELPEGAGPES